MICKKCGEEIADNSAFCPVCGAKIEAEPVVETVEETVAEAPVEAAAENKPEEKEAEAQPETKTEAAPAVDPVPSTVDPSVAVKATGKKVADALRKVPAKVWGIIAAAVLAVIVICNIISCAAGKSPYVTIATKDGLALVATEDTVTFGGKVISIGERISDSISNYNGSFMAVLDSEDTLWAVNTKKAVKISEDVVKFSVSFYGDTVVYAVRDGEDYEVYAYDVSKKKSKKIYDENYNRVVISPNGKMVALRNSDGDLLISKKSGTAKKEYSDATPVAISNDGKMVFYEKNSKFYANDEKVCTAEGLGRVYLNISNDEVMVNANGSTYYYGSKLKEAVKVKGDTFSGVVVPDDVAVVATGSSAYTYGIKSFNNMPVAIGGAIYYMTKKGEELEKVCGSASSYVVSADGKSMIYTAGDDIYKIANIKKASEPKKIGKEVEARFLIASDDLKKIYYVTKDKELRYLKSNGKGEAIADDVQMVSIFGQVYGCEVTYDKKLKCVVYVNEDNELMTAKTSKKSKQKLSISDAKAISLLSNGYSTFVQVTDEDNNLVFYSVKSAKKVKKLATVDLSTSIMAD